MVWAPRRRPASVDAFAEAALAGLAAAGHTGEEETRPHGGTGERRRADGPTGQGRGRAAPEAREKNRVTGVPPVSGE